MSTIVDGTVAEWKAWKAEGHRNVTWVGLTGEQRHQGVLLSVSAEGLRVRFRTFRPGEHGRIERVHPRDVRPGWLS